MLSTQKHTFETRLVDLEPVMENVKERTKAVCRTNTDRPVFLFMFNRFT